MKRVLILLFVMGVGSAPAWAGIPISISIESSFDPEKHVISGEQGIEFDVAPGKAYFLLLANLGREPNPYVSGRALDQLYPYGFDPAWTKIEGVSWRDGDGERALPWRLLPFPPAMQTYSLDDGILEVDLPDGKAGTLIIQFRTRFPRTAVGEPGRIGDIHTWRFGWHPLLYPVPPEDWEGYGFRLPAYDYRLVLRLPSDWVAVLPGDEVEEREEGEVTVYEVRWDRPVRSLPLYLAPKGEVRRFLVEGKGISVEGWYLPGYEGELRSLATWSLEILDWYRERFGEPPLRKFLLVIHPNRQGTSFTADGIVFLSRWYFDRLDLTAKGILSRLLRFVLAHELAHFWWGVGMAPDFLAENWLSEAFAQYMSISWFEAEYGAEGGNLFVPELQGIGEEMTENLLGFVNLREHFVELPYLDSVFMGFDEAVVKPFQKVRYHQQDYVRYYDKGYLIVRALEDYIGTEAFRGALREIYRKYAGKEIRVEDLRRELESYTGVELGEFFSHWVTGEARADYAVVRLESEKVEGGYESQVVLEFRGSAPLPVEVVLHGKGEGEEHSLKWSPRAPGREELRAVTGFRPARVSVDPGHRVPDVDRLNNHYPRKFKVIVGKRDFPLDAYYLEALDPSSGAIAGGYLNRFGWVILPQERYISGYVRYGREGALSLWARAGEGGGLTGAISWNQYLWTTPEVGIPGGYWTLTGIAEVGLLKLPESGFAPFAEVAWADFLKGGHWGRVSLLYAGGDQRLWIQLGKELRLVPRGYLQLSAGLGRAGEGIPESLKFGLEEMLLSSGRGREKLSLRGTLLAPPWEGDYRIGDLLLLSGIQPGAFITAARLDGGPWYAEAGAFLAGRFEALGGFLGFNAVVGIVYPLLPDTGDGKVFFGISREF